MSTNHPTNRKARADFPPFFQSCYNFSLMSALWTSPLGPVGLLLGGGTLLLMLQRRISDRLRQILPVALLLAGMASWLLLRLQPQGAGQWWAWQAPLGLETALGVQWDNWAWLAGWLLFMLALSALILPEWLTRAGFTPPAFWVPFLLAASLLVITAATWSTLLTAWTLMLFFTGILAGTPSQNAARAWTFLLLSGFFLLTTPLFNGAGSLLATLDSDALNLQAQLLLILAIAIPLGVYPFHIWLTPGASRPRGRQMALHLLPGLAALHLLSRFQLPLLGSFSWVTLGIAGLLGSAIAAWLAENAHNAWVYVIINRVTWVMLALSLSRETGLRQMLFALPTLAIAGIIWSLISNPSPSHKMRWLALFFLLGFPFTTGFPLNLNLAQLATTVLGFPGWVLVLLAQTILIAAVLRPAVSQPEPETPKSYLPAKRLNWMLALTVIFGLWWGIFPAALARTAGLTPHGIYASVLTQIRTAGLLTGWLTLLLPLLLGWLLARWRQRIFAGLEAWQSRIGAVAGLGWLDSLLAAGFHYLSLSFGFAADILDGAGQFGWVLLALLILWLFLR